MSNRFHSKFHRSNHHTYTNSANPDAGHDPIASPDSPFLGDFVLKGGLSALVPSGSKYSATFLGAGVGVGTITPNTSLTVVGSISASNNIIVGYNNQAVDTSSIGGGFNNSISSPYSYIGDGSNNSISNSYSYIGGGNNNNISGRYSFIAAGSSNYTNFPNTFILGSGLSANQANFTFVNNLSTPGSVIANSISSRFIYLLHSNPNDGINPVVFLGENGNGSLSGFNTSYDEIQNKYFISTFFGDGSIVPYTTAFLIDQSGNVGINTNSPNNKLTVNGSISGLGNLYINSNEYITGSSYVSGNQLLAGSSYISGSQYLSGAYSVKGHIYASGSQYLSGSLFTGNNVSINTTNQTNALTVKGSISASDTLYGNTINCATLNATTLNATNEFVTNKTTVYFSSSTGNSLILGNQFNLTPLTLSGNAVLLNAFNSSTLNPVFYMTSNGYVGINTNNPSANLTVVGNINASSDISTSGSLLASKPIVVSTSPTSNLNIAPLSATGSATGSVYSSIQNIVAGVSASTDYTMYNDQGNYLDIGINSSQYNGNLYYPKFNIVGPGDSYIFNTANNIVMGTGSSSGNLLFFTGGTSSSNERMRITNSGNIAIGTTTTDSNSVLTIKGDVSINGNLSYNNSNNGPVINGSVRNIILGSAGQGYSSAPTITIDPPTDVLDNNIQATATCTINNGAINSITITNPGRGYITHPNITISGGGSPTQPAVMWAMADVRATSNPRGRSSYASTVLFSDGRLFSAGYNNSIPNGYSVSGTSYVNPVNVPIYTSSDTNPSYFVIPETYSLNTPAGYQNIPAGRPVEYWNTGDHLYVLDSNGNLWSGGENANGELGLGNNTSQYILTRIIFNQNSSTYGQLLNTNNQIVRFSVSKDADRSGRTSCIALAANGAIYTWGYNGWGQLGIVNSKGTLNTAAHNSPVCLNNYVGGNTGVGGGTSITVPSAPSAPYVFPKQYKNVYMIGDGYTSCSFILKNDGSVLAAGYNAFGQLGIGNTTNPPSFTPVLSAANAPIGNVKEIHGNSYGGGYISCTYFLCNDGSLWSTGHNSYGALGLGDTTQRVYATKITALSNYNITKFRTMTRQEDYGFCVASDGTNIWTWGRNDFGQLGKGVANNTANPTPFLVNTVPLNYSNTPNTTTYVGNAATTWSGITIKDIAIGQACFAILTNNGKVYSCGYNKVGQLGLSNGLDYAAFLTHVNIPTDNAASIAICGPTVNQFLQIITSSGKIYASGYNGHGELGTGDTGGYYYLPTQVYKGL